MDWYIYGYRRGIKTKPHLLLHIFHDTSLGDPAWKPIPLRGRGFHAGRLVKYHGKYASTMWFCFMVTYSLRRVCGSLTINLIHQTVRRPYGLYVSRAATSRCLAHRKVIASLAIFLLEFFFQKPQRRNAATTPQVHHKATVQGREVTYGFYPA